MRLYLSFRKTYFDFSNELQSNFEKFHDPVRLLMKTLALELKFQVRIPDFHPIEDF